MKDYKVIGNYNLFKQVNVDLVGTNYRAGKIADGKITEHAVFSEVHPYLYKSEDVWKRIELLLNGVKKSKITNLYSPDVIVNEEKKQLVYPSLQGASVERILEDSGKKNVPINFDLALSIAMGIADLLEAGSSIAVSGKRSFHGFLTPDNIMIDHDGNIWVKNYGIYAYLNTTEEIHKELEMKYGAWVTPEFIRKEKPLPQSDIYHLGFIIYKMATGNYFSYTEGENFDSKLANISFLQNIPTTDKDFLANIQLFFKKTLHPDPAQRFANIKEFREFISNYFHIEELSSVTFNIAYFMSSLYSKERDQLDREMAEELKYVIPKKKKAVQQQDTGKDSEIVDNLLSGLDEREKSKSKNLLLVVGLVIVLAVVGIFVITSMGGGGEPTVDPQLDTKKKAAEIEKAREIENLRKRLAQQTKEKEMALMKAQEEARKKAELENKIKEEKDAKEKARLEQELIKQKKKDEEAKKKAEEAKEKEEQLKKEKEAEEERKRKEEAVKEAARKKEEARKKALKVGDMVTDVDKKPVEINTEIPELPRRLRKKIKGDAVQVTVSVIVDETGGVKKVKFTKKSGIPELDMELSQIIYNWKFKPATKYDKKVSTWFTKVLTIKK